MSDSIKPTAVIAGNHQQYLQYLREHSLDPKQYLYASDPYRVMGIHWAGVVTVGSWYESKDAHEAKRIVESNIR